MKGIKEIKILKTTQQKTLRKRREKWNEEELKKYEEGVQLFGRNYRRIAEFIGTKTIHQVRSHSQTHQVQQTEHVLTTVTPPKPPETVIPSQSFDINEIKDIKMEEQHDDINNHDTNNNDDDEWKEIQEMKQRIRQRIERIDMIECAKQQELHHFLTELYKTYGSTQLFDSKGIIDTTQQQSFSLPITSTLTTTNTPLHNDCQKEMDIQHELNPLFNLTEL